MDASHHRARTRRTSSFGARANAMKSPDGAMSVGQSCLANIGYARSPELINSEPSAVERLVERLLTESLCVPCIPGRPASRSMSSRQRPSASAWRMPNASPTSQRASIRSPWQPQSAAGPQLPKAEHLVLPPTWRINQQCGTDRDELPFDRSAEDRIRRSRSWSEPGPTYTLTATAREDAAGFAGRT
jgi:hypothetical protein